MAAVAGRLIQKLPKGSASHRVSRMRHPTDACFWHRFPWRLSFTKAWLSACSFHAQQSDPGKTGWDSALGVAAKSNSTQTSDAPGVSVTKPNRRKKSPTKKALAELYRENWLAALNSPKDLSSSLLMPSSLFNSSDLLRRNCIEEEKVAAELATLGGAITSLNALPIASGTSYVLGIDPDLTGALAVIKTDDFSSVEVFDVPSVQVMIGMKKRKRHDARSITALINDINAPHGSVAYIEQSVPFPKDGKQGWWASGFGFGMWIGVLVACGFSVVPVRSSVWKGAMGLCGKSVTKDDSRLTASLLFPLLSPQLQRKKDHGRAEALLIAAFGKGIPAPLQQVVETGISWNVKTCVHFPI